MEYEQITKSQIEVLIPEFKTRIEDLTNEINTPPERIAQLVNGRYYWQDGPIDQAALEKLRKELAQKKRKLKEFEEALASYPPQ